MPVHRSEGDTLATPDLLARRAIDAARDCADRGGYSVAVVLVKPGDEQQFIHAGEHRLMLLGALDVVRADVVDDTPRDESNA